MKKILLATVAVLVLTSSSSPPVAQAARSSVNGDITFLAGPNDMAPRSDDVFVMAPDGSDARNVSNTEFPIDEGRPVWSPNGRKILFTSNRDGDWDIYVMRNDGSRVKQLTHNRRRDRDGWWNPTGRKIVYTSSRRGVQDLFVMNADGTRRRRITSLNTSAESPTWSPTGNVIVFGMATGEGENRDLYTVRPDGTGLRALARTPEAEYAPAWSPDGKRIAYKSIPPAPCGSCDWLERSSIFVMRISSGDRRALTDDTGNDDYPTWSPDGTKIAFASYRGDPSYQFDIYVMNADGSDVTNITSSPGTNEYQPHWQAR